MSSWLNAASYVPPISTPLKVKDSLSGPEYTAKWLGHNGGGWVVLSFAPGVVPTGHPLFWYAV